MCAFQNSIWPNSEKIDKSTSQVPYRFSYEGLYHHHCRVSIQLLGVETEQKSKIEGLRKVTIGLQYTFMVSAHSHEKNMRPQFSKDTVEA